MVEYEGNHRDAGAEQGERERVEIDEFLLLFYRQMKPVMTYIERRCLPRRRQNKGKRIGRAN